VLKDILDKHLEDKIHIVAVVAVMGTTEESSIDPLSQILHLQKSYTKKVNQLFLQLSNAFTFFQHDITLAKTSKSILNYPHPLTLVKPAET